MLNLLKKTIQEKGCAVGTFLGVSNVSIVEGLAYTGLDFVVIDTEHGPYDTETMSDLAKAAENGGVAPIVRIGDVTHKEIQRAVDNGVQGLIVPNLRSIDEFRKVVELAKFAPLGNRGFTLARGSGFGCAPWASGSLEDYMKNSNERLLLLPQCETKEALEQIEQIVQIEGIDGIFIGPYDLSICMGIPGQFASPEFQEALARVQTACRNAGKLCMIFAMQPKKGHEYLTMGFDAVAIGIDSGVFVDAYQKIVEETRAMR